MPCVETLVVKIQSSVEGEESLEAFGGLEMLADIGAGARCRYDGLVTTVRSVTKGQQKGKSIASIAIALIGLNAAF